MRPRFAHILLCTGVLLTPSGLGAQSMGFSAGAGMSFPLQEFADTYAPGFTSQLAGEYQIMGSITLVVSTGYSVWPIQEGLGDQLLNDAQLPGTLRVDGQIRNIPLSLGVRYYSLGLFGHTFLGLSTGTNLMRGTADVTYDPQSGIPATSTPVRESWSSTGFTIEAGSSFLLSDSWSVLVVLSYASILHLSHEIIPRSQGIPVTASPPQARLLGATIGIQYK